MGAEDVTEPGGVGIDWIRREQRARARLGADAPGLALDERRRLARAVSDLLAEEAAAPVDERARIHEIALPGVAGESFARVYEPPGTPSSPPTQLFLHGGGFLFGGARERVNDALLSARSVATGLRIVSYEYALAPEHPYPAARDEVVRVFRLLHDRAEELRIDAERIGIGGMSAGGSVAASAALVLVREGGPVPFHASLEAPALSLRGIGERSADDAPHPAMAAQIAEYPALSAAYAPGAPDLAFVADADTVEGFPPTLLVLAEFDVLTDGALGFAQRLRAQGGHVRVHVRAGHVHGSPAATAISPEARSWQDLVARELREAYGTEGAGADAG
ncbi:alpha/beta hydrolase [Microbacterium betulae]|uniref:Alpha/beta hydrolase n=1 Tax=Microbacterium betulae TaxID=2981139 RepID=A0AA97I6D6_9MICO|nr:alpha/beta hydrolase [Microbacterium sp. AB]WOF23744.1 alpha/beta hydrolase [Microbacterium sp. AB]